VLSLLHARAARALRTETHTKICVRGAHLNFSLYHTRQPLVRFIYLTNKCAQRPRRTPTASTVTWLSFLRGGCKFFAYTARCGKEKINTLVSVRGRARLTCKTQMGTFGGPNRDGRDDRRPDRARLHVWRMLCSFDRTPVRATPATLSPATTVHRRRVSAKSGFILCATLKQEWSVDRLSLARTAMCVRNVDAHVSCSSHSDAHLAAFFIDPRAE
jgi:hypothetical protein